MKISVVIPYTTGLQLLSDCLDSLKEQTIKDFEVILVQDQIPDWLNKEGNVKHIEDPTDVIAEFQTTCCIHYIQAESNIGVGACRNMGLQYATGEYIYFLDMDDYLMATTLEELLQLAEHAKQEGTDAVVYGDQWTTWYKRYVFLQAMKEQETNQDQTSIFQLAIVPQEGQRTEGDDLEYIIDTSDCEVGLQEFVQKKMIEPRGIVNISALHILIPRRLIEQYDLRFEEDLPLYSDVVFVSKLVSCTSSFIYTPTARYIKRKRNNPVQYPAIVQSKAEQLFWWMLQGYERAKNNLGQQPNIARILDQKIINYYTNYFVTKLRRSEKPYWKTERFEAMSRVMNQLDLEHIKMQSRYKRRILWASKHNQVKLSLLFVNVRLGRKKALKMVKNKKYLMSYLYFNYFTKLPVKENYIMCESFLGRIYADSPKNIYEYMSEQYPGKYTFIWSVNKKTTFPYPCKVVKRFGIRYAYYLARSKYFVFNMRQPTWMRKRENTTFIQTWHGTPLKRLVFDQEEVCSASPLYKQQFYKQSRKWDYLISDNEFSTEVFRNAFLFDKQIIEKGYPRNDILYHPEKESICINIKKRLGLPVDKKVILYAPTWRDDEYYDKGQYRFALHMELNKFQEAIGDEYIILLRTHYFIADQLDIGEQKGFVYNVSDYDDISELYLISDICITDYSSVFFDYANLKRPILFYTYDLEKYRDILRGFYLDIETEVPGPLLFNDDEVIHAIQNIEDISRQYATRYEAFYQRFCSLDDGNATKRIVDEIFLNEKQTVQRSVCE